MREGADFLNDVFIRRIVYSGEELIFLFRDLHPDYFFIGMTR